MILDLFGGPGGWSEGLNALGREDVGIEWDRDACATRRAAGHATIRADVASYPRHVFAGRLEGLIASPPCTAFSMAGKGAARAEVDAICATIYGTSAPELLHEGSRLVLEPMAWTLELMPEWVAWEQVPPVLPIWEACAYRLRDAGYSVWCGILSSECFGVPQTRKRAILMGHRRRIVTPPAPTHQRYVNGVPAQRQDGMFGTLEPWISMAEALSGTWPSGKDAPTVTAGGTGAGGYEPFGRGGREAIRGAWVARERSGERSEEGFDPDEMPSQTLTSKARSWVVDRRTNSKDGKGGMVPTAPRDVETPAPTLTGKTGGQWVLRHGSLENSAERSPDQPAATMLFGHRMNDDSWVERRPATTVCGDTRLPPPGYRKGTERSMTNAIRLSIEEAAILQGFRPDYPWAGSRTSWFTQVGNAICPPLAAAILRELL